MKVGFKIVAHSVLSPELLVEPFKKSDEEEESHHIRNCSPGFMSFKCCASKKYFIGKWNSIATIPFVTYCCSKISSL